MKSKLFILMFCMIFLIGSVSALDFSIDNYKEMDKSKGEYGTISFYDWQLLDENKKLTEVTLLENTEYCGELYGFNCTARLKVKIYEPSKILDELNFKKMNIDSWKNDNFNKYTIKIKTGEITKENKTQEIFEDYNFDTKDIGEYIILFEGLIPSGEVFDWLGTWNGIEAKEWELWNGSATQGLISWYQFEGDYNDTTNNATLILTGSAPFVAGKIGDNATLLLGNTGNRLINDSIGIQNLPTAAAGTVEYWFQVRNLSSGTANNPGKWMFSIPTGDSSNSLRVGVNNNTLECALFNGAGYNRIQHQYVALNPDEWHHMACTWNSTGWDMYLNGTKVTTGIPPGTGWSATGVCVGLECQTTASFFNSFNGTLDDLKVFNLYRNETEIQSDLQDIPIPSLAIVQNAPPNGITSINNTQNLSCNVTGIGNANVTSVSFNVYNSSNNLDFSGTNSGFNNISINTSIITSALSDGLFNWSCNATSTNASAFVTSENRTFILDSSPPNITLIAPNETFNFHLVGDNLTLNWTVNDSNLQSCWFVYNNTNTTVTCSDNNFSFITTTQKNLTFFANDSGGNQNSSFTSWDYKILEINQTFNNQTTEGSLETFLATILLGNGLSIDNINFYYNNTLSSGQSFASGDNIILRKADFLIPNVDTRTNNTFIWEVILSDSSHINLTSQNQTVLNLGLDNCSGFNNELLNFTVVDEEFQTNLPNATVEIAVNVFSEDRTELIINFSNIFQNTNPVSICLNENISADTIYSLDSIIRYVGDDHANEYYNIVNLLLTNDSTVQKITLFDLNLSDSTEFQLTFTGSNFLPVENALINVDRQYISENLFKTVELPKTDFNGQTILHLVVNDVIYNIRIIKDGVVLGNFENLVAFCDDITIGDCNIELNAFDSVENIFNYDEDLGIIFQDAPKFNSTTNRVSFNFVTSDGSAKTVTLEVSRNDIFGNRSICNSSLTSSGGTLFCDVDPNIEDSDLRIQILTNDVLTLTGNVELDTTNYGAAGYLIMFLMAMSFALLFSGSKTGVLFSIGLTFAGSIGLSLSSGNLVGVGASGLWLLVIIFIGIYKLNAERQP